MKTLQHFLTGIELSASQRLDLLRLALTMKMDRQKNKFSDNAMSSKLKNKHLALLFDKPSLRTRFSFTVAMRELGGDVVESISDTRKSEKPEDQARVLEGYCQGIMVRTHADDILTRMALVSRVPVINGLSDLHHPCQILADLLTLQEVFGDLRGLVLAYLGDGNNILHSLLLMAPQLGVDIHYCCPVSRQPDSTIVQQAVQQLTTMDGEIKSFTIPQEVVAGANAVYTDVWTSMGFEETKAEHLFEGFQVNEALMQLAAPNAVFMHCLPMERGKEVSQSLPDQPCSVIFQQSENRLHAQKALLLNLL